MKETKVYVDELPENCKKCVYSQINLAFGVETRICNLQYGFISANNDKFPNCPLQSLKIHDRELVKEVCEKIREYLRTQVIYCGGRATELDIMIASAGNQVLEDVKQFLDQIQKLEGEDE